MEQWLIFSKNNIIIIKYSRYIEKVIWDICIPIKFTYLCLLRSMYQVFLWMNYSFKFSFNIWENSTRKYTLENNSVSELYLPTYFNFIFLKRRSYKEEKVLKKNILHFTLSYSTYPYGFLSFTYTVYDVDEKKSCV